MCGMREWSGTLMLHLQVNPASQLVDMDCQKEM